jgi:hypothetical protein
MIAELFGVDRSDAIRGEMLKLLLDEHISPAVAEGLRRGNRLLVVFCMAEWEDGEFLGRTILSICKKPPPNG